VTSSPFGEFALDQPTAPQPQPSPILPPGYLWALDPATSSMVAVRVQEPSAPAPALAPAAAPQPAPAGPELTALEKALLYARTQPDPIPATEAPAPQGLNPAVWQGAILGGVGVVALSVSAWVLSEALRTAAPNLHYVPLILEWSAALLAVAVVGLVVVKVRTRTSADGTTVNALVHRTSNVSIGKQSAGWKGTVSNTHR